MPLFNCECEADPLGRTLLDMRTELLRRTGYAAQAANPPPGIAELYDSIIRGAQDYLYRRYEELRTERFYRWTMTVGERFYGLRANIDECEVKLDAYKVTWVGFSDDNETWLPLIKGINPVFYTRSPQPGRPSHYEIRSCIEVFPAPDRAYVLRVKGRFGLEPLVAPTDVTTINAGLVFLWALGLAKADRGHKDADLYFTQAEHYIRSLTAGSHHTARYIPGVEDMPPAPQPFMTEFLP